MTGLIFYIDKNGNEKKAEVQGMTYKETAAEYLERRNISFQKVIACNLND